MSQIVNLIALPMTDRLTDVLAPIMAWWITFTVVLLLLFAVGFNPIGIGAGMTHP